MMKLFLVQHGEAVAKEVDAERPLSAEGEADVARMGGFLGKHLPQARIVHSGKRRAEQTAELLAANQPVEAIKGIAPKDAIEPFVAQLEEWSGDTVVVGHLPFMAKLVATLVTGSGEPAITAYQPGSVVCLERAGDGHWQIQWMVRPELVEG